MDIDNFFIERGCGEPLLLLHGNGENSEYFKNQISEFSSKYHVYAIDTRGHGKTPRGNAPFTIVQFAEDLKCFMDEHNILRAHILGFSDGGNIALTFALKYPERVNRLILNGANLYPSGMKPSVLLPIILGYIAAGMFGGRNKSARCKRELLGLMVNEPHISPSELNRLTVKTLVIAGKRDMIKARHTRLIAKSIPNSRLVFLDGDHFIANKCPVEFNRSVMAFLQDK